MDKYDISLRDVTFLTGRSPEDLVQNGNVSINDTDVENLNNVREILTKNNIFALLKNHDVSEIARFYHYNVSTVMYVVSSI
jgi:hypothetical protein